MSSLLLICLSLALAWQLMVHDRLDSFSKARYRLLTGVTAGILCYGGFFLPGPLGYPFGWAETYPAEAIFLAGLLLAGLSVLADKVGKGKLYGLLLLFFLSAWSVGGSLALSGASEWGIRLAAPWSLALVYGLLMLGLTLLPLWRRPAPVLRLSAGPLFRYCGSLLLIMGLLLPAVERASVDIFQPCALPAVSAPVAGGLLFAVLALMAWGYQKSLSQVRS